MTVTLTGATGFVATNLIPRLRAAGHDLRTLGRRPLQDLPFHRWESSATEPPVEALDGADVVIHLAGETVAQRWTTEAKRRIGSSRIDGTRNLVSSLAKAVHKPSLLLAASAVGIYGSRGDEILTETAAHGLGFLADLALEWEAAARAAESLGIRVVYLRFGLILGRDGGAFPKMLTPFRFGLGGRLGSGKQWLPWIHIDDAAKMITFAMDAATVRGPVNVTAPEPVTNAEFTRKLAAALHRPGFMAAPTFALKIVLGEMAETLLASERVVPAAAQAVGFRFTYPDLDSALHQLVSP